MSQIPEPKMSPDIQSLATTDINDNPLAIALYQTIEYAPMGIAIFNQDMQYLAVSQKWLEIYKLTQDIIGKSHYDIFPDIPEKWRQIHQQCLAGADAHNYADYFPRADGFGEWVNWSIRPWYLATGEVGGIMIFTENITQRKQTELALQRNEERYRSLITATCQIVWILPPDGLVINDIPAWREFTGQTLEEILGSGWLDAVHPDDRLLTAQAWEKAVKNKNLFEIECRIRRYDGEYFYWLTRSVPVLEADGSIREWIGVQTNIQDRKQTEEDLLESNTLLRSILNSTPDYIVVKDVQGQYVTLNSNAANFMGRAVEEIIGKNDFELMPLEVARKYTIQDQQIITTGINTTDEEYLCSADGRINGTFRTTKTPWQDTDGNILGVIALASDISDRKQAEEDLRHSNTLIRSVLDSTPDFIFVKDCQGRYVTVNTEMANFLGKSIDEIVGKDDTEIFSSDVVSEIRAKDHEIMTTGKTEIFEEDVSFGTVKTTFLTTKAPWRDAQGNTLGLIGITRNISDRKQIEEDLRDSNTLLRSILESTPDFIVVKDFQGRHVALNSNLANLMGKPIEDIIGKDDTEILPLDFAQTIMAKDRQIMITGETETFEEDVSTGGINGTFLTTKAPWRDHHGNIIGMIAITRNISDRKQAEFKLRQTLEILDSASDSIIIRDMDDRIAYWNRGAEVLYGWKREEVIGQYIHTFLKTVFPKPLENILSEFLQQGHWEGELHHQTCDGRSIIVASRWTLQRDENGQSYNQLEINNDITERKQAEFALAQAKEAAEAASHAKSEFLANMSHELRTPLNGILGYAQILQRSKHLNEDERSRIDVMYQCGSHLLTLINDILDLSKIEAQKVELMTSDFHFPAFLQGVAEMCRIRAELKGIQFQYQFASELPIGIRADEKRLRQVLINLLSNAIKFTDVGQVTFTISYASGGKIRFQVRDTGVGIAQEKLQAIFQPFEQVGDRRRQTEGTGLGLAISQRIVELMDSTIHVQSEIGVGSIFWFDVYLPEAQEWVKTSQADDFGQIIGIKDRKPKILVVDDKWENRSVIYNLLTPIGFAVTEANDGAEGWQKIAEFQPDLVITDLLMPELDGFELIHHIRQSEAFKHIVIIVSSASVFESDQHRSIEAGGNDFLPKPVQAIALFQKLRQFLNLEWLYEEQSPENQSVAHQVNFILPPQTEIETLYELVMKGNFKGIIKQAALISQIDPKYLPFAKRLQQLAQEFQDQEILALIHPQQ